MNDITNEEKYKTADERLKAFRLWLGTAGREIENLSDDPRFASWLARKVEDETPDVCPFCFGKCECVKEQNGKSRVVCNEKEDCCYSSRLYSTEYEAIKNHNLISYAAQNM